MDPNSPLVEAHRGDSQRCPENSLSAFRNAALAGATSVELDVHGTSDGELVVMHDGSVDRTTNGVGAIDCLTLRDIRELDCGAWKAPEFRGERVPTLAEALELARSQGFGLNVEVKHTAGKKDLPQRLVDLLRRYPSRVGRHVVSSFDTKALLQVREADPTVPLAILGDGPAALAAARDLGFPWIHAQWRTMSADVVAGAHVSGIRVMIWTLDHPELFAHAARMGVDKVCTNRPGAMVGALRAASRY